MLALLLLFNLTVGFATAGRNRPVKASSGHAERLTALFARPHPVIRYQGLEWRPPVRRRMIVTAYCWTGHRTATGPWPRKGMAAVKAGVARYGAVLAVAGQGWYTVADREPPNGVSHVDLYAGWRTHCERFARWFGKRELAVAVL